MKLFECIVDDGTNVFKSLCTAKNKKELLDIYGGNGEFVKVTDRTNEYFDETSAEKLRNDLLRTGWGEGETRLIVALLEEHIEKKRGKKNGTKKEYNHDVGNGRRTNASV